MLWLFSVSAVQAACGPAGCPDPAVEAQVAALPDGPRPAPPLDARRPDEVRRAVFALG